MRCDGNYFEEDGANFDWCPVCSDYIYTDNRICPKQEKHDEDDEQDDKE